MAEPILLDTNVLKDVSRGNQQVADALNRYVKSGTPVYISRAAYDELVTGALSPQMGGQYREMLKDLGIQIAPSGPLTDRLEFHGANIDHTPAPNEPGQVKDFSGRDGTRPGDAFVASQAKAINARLWTVDGKFARRAQNLNVKVAPECFTIPGISGTEDPVLGRERLKLEPKPIGINGEVLPTKPGGGGKKGGGGGSGSSGTGFKASNIQGIANGLAMFQSWAEAQSRINVAWEAWDELDKREDEIIHEQHVNPLYPVYIKIYWKVDFENNPNMPKLYTYLGADIQNGCNGRPASLWDSIQHSYLMTIPALKAGGAPVVNQSATTWRDRYTYVVATIKGGHSQGGDPVAALRILNGLAMYDILPILKLLKTNEAFLLDKLEQALSWPSTNVGVDRLEAAILAVRLSDNPGNLTNYYKAKEFTSLPSDQQKDIEDFLAGRSKEAQKALPKWVQGWWTVYDGNYYYYYFQESASVGYIKIKPTNGSAPPPKFPANQGKVAMTEHGLKITWNPIGPGGPTVETFTQRDCSSTTEMNGDSTKYSQLFARKIA